MTRYLLLVEGDSHGKMVTNEDGSVRHFTYLADVFEYLKEQGLKRGEFNIYKELL